MNYRIRTSDKELFRKLNSLKFTDEVVVNNKKGMTNKIIKNINKNGKQISTQHIGNKILIRRLKPLNFNLQYINR